MNTDTLTPKTRTCPYCEQELLLRALQCRHCRRWLPEVVPDAEVAEPSQEPQMELVGDEPSNAQSIRHLVLLTLMSFGLYEFYWFYRNWRDLSELDTEREDAFSPGLRTAGLIVPFLNIALVYGQFRRIRETLDDAGFTPMFAPGLTAIAFFALAIVANLSGIWILSLFTVFPLVPVQVALNEYWTASQPGRPVRDSISGIEILIVVVGIAAMTLATIVASKAA